VPYDEKLAGRIREALRGQRNVVEKRMFGGLAFMVRGHMCVGIAGNDLMVRVGPEAYAKAIREPHARPMDFTGRPLTGFVYVGPSGHARRQSLAKWVKRALGFVRSLPSK
jgi:TfoX/Sxy family transcriptional regulator of competence genes